MRSVGNLKLNDGMEWVKPVFKSGPTRLNNREYLQQIALKREIDSYFLSGGKLGVSLSPLLPLLVTIEHKIDLGMVLTGDNETTLKKLIAGRELFTAFAKDNLHQNEERLADFMKFLDKAENYLEKRKSIRNDSMQTDRILN